MPQSASAAAKHAYREGSAKRSRVRRTVPADEEGSGMALAGKAQSWVLKVEH